MITRALTKMFFCIPLKSRSKTFYKQMLSIFYDLLGSVWEAEARSGRSRLDPIDRGSCLVGLGSQSGRLGNVC